jgi:hypothetical protein
VDTAKYIAFLFDANGRKVTTLMGGDEFSVYPNDTTPTWEDIMLRNQAPRRKLPDTYYTASQVDSILSDAGVGGFGPPGDRDLWYLDPDPYIANLESPVSISNGGDLYSVADNWAGLELNNELSGTGASKFYIGTLNNINVRGDHTSSWIYGIYSLANNRFATGSGTRIIGGNIAAQAEAAAASVLGLSVGAIRGNINSTPLITGLEVSGLNGYSNATEVIAQKISFGAQSSPATVDLTKGLQIRAASSGGAHAYTDLRAISLDNWNWTGGGTCGTSYGIYADATIDKGTTRYFIYSLSTSPSLFSGDVSVPDEAYGVGWNGSLEVPTKNALYDKIESLVLGGGGADDTPYGVIWNGSTLAPTQNSVYDKIEALVLSGGGDTLLNGQAGGQILHGGTGSGDDLTLRSTAHATKGSIFIGEASAYDHVNERLGIGVLAPSTKFHVVATAQQFRVGYDSSNFLDVAVGSSGSCELIAKGSSPSFTISGGPASATSLCSITGTGGTIGVSGGSLQLSGGSGGISSGDGGHLVLKGGVVQGTGTAGAVQIQNPDNDFLATLDVTGLGADRAFTFPDQDGTIALIDNDITVPDEAYGTGWNGSLEVPTKNAVYDKMETVASGYTTIIKSANQDVTNAGVTDDSELSFATVAGGHYAIDMEVIFSGNDTTGDYVMDLALAAGTMKGKGTCQGTSSVGAPQNFIVTAAGAANTSGVSMGVPTADLDDLVFARLGFAFTVTDTTTLTFRFGNNTPAGGRTSRTWKGSTMRWKRID